MGKKLVHILALLCMGWVLLLTVYWFYIISDMENGWHALGFLLLIAPLTVIVGLGAVVIPSAVMYKLKGMKEERLTLWLASIALIIITMEALSLMSYHFHGH